MGAGMAHKWCVDKTTPMRIDGARSELIWTGPSLTWNARETKMKQNNVSLARLLSAAEIVHAREWIADCVWGDLIDAEDIRQLSDEQVARGIARHYSGGIPAFKLDCIVQVMPAIVTSANAA